MSSNDRDHLASNIVGHLGAGVARPVQERALALWRKVDPDLGARMAQGLGLGDPARASALR